VPAEGCLSGEASSANNANHHAFLVDSIDAAEQVVRTDSKRSVSPVRMHLDHIGSPVIERAPATAGAPVISENVPIGKS